MSIIRLTRVPEPCMISSVYALIAYRMMGTTLRFPAGKVLYCKSSFPQGIITTEAMKSRASRDTDARITEIPQ